jgi:hypothetical protein
MTDAKTETKGDTTGDRIIKAVAEERRRIMASRPTIETKIGFTNISPQLPTFTVTITGGDPGAVSDLGREIAQLALQAMRGLEFENDPA